MSMPPKPKQGFREIDFRVGVTMLFSVIVFYVLYSLTGGAASNYINICIMTIAVAYLADLDWKTSWQSGLSRILITGIGALLALIPIVAYNLTQSDVLLIILFAAVGVCVMVVAKLSGKMYVQCRTAAVAYTLSVFTFHGFNPFQAASYAEQGKTCQGYVLMWILSTIAAVAITVVVAFIWDAIKAVIVKRKAAA